MQIPGESEGMSQAVIWRNSIPGRGDSSCKDSKAGACGLFEGQQEDHCSSNRVSKGESSG